MITTSENYVRDIVKRNVMGRIVMMTTVRDWTARTPLNAPAATAKTNIFLSR